MFIGHYAVGLAAKKAAPSASLGTLVLASLFVDYMFPILSLLGLEHLRIDPGNSTVVPVDFYDYPISHSLLMDVIWSLLFGGIYYALRRDRTNAMVVGLCVFSHWILDFISHRPDLPLAFGNSPRAGLGLWYSLWGTVIVETLLFLAGIAVYLSATKANDRIGVYAFWSFVALLFGLSISSTFGPPPPNSDAFAFVGMLSWLFILWAWWIDRHRPAVHDRVLHASPQATT